jgi:hypothetical protein
MKVTWLNEGLVVKGESKEEKVALAVIFKSLAQPEPENINQEMEGSAVKYPSIS